MGLLKKIFKPVAKVLDKVIPNEIKPALPFAAAFAPFLLGPGAASGSAFQKLLFIAFVHRSKVLKSHGTIRMLHKKLRSSRLALFLPCLVITSLMQVEMNSSCCYQE